MFIMLKGGERTLRLFSGIERLGSGIRLVFGKVFMALFFVLSFPFKLLLKLLLAVFSRVKRAAKNSFRHIVGNKKFFSGRALRGVKTIMLALIKNPRSVPGLIKHYAYRCVKRYGGLVRYFILLLIPVGAAAVFAVVILHYAMLSPALCLSVNGETLGYVSSENEYISARANAAERLSLGTDGKTDISAILPEVSISSERISINKFTGEEALSEKLIELSSAELTNACGITVDGEFLCAVKNEADARRVFEGVLSSNSENSESTIVSFLQDICYVQGLYPDNDAVIWDADKLLERLESYKEKDRLTVKTVKTEIENVISDFETVEIPSDLLYIGTRRTVADGEKGAQQITKIVTYVDGEKTGEEEISRITLKEPRAERVQVGTRALDSSYVIAENYGGILLWPAVGATRINSDYSFRWGKMHKALDIGSYNGSSLGKTVIAAAGGTVVISGVHSSYGYYVKIDHGNGMQTLYGHCMAGSLMVNVGDKVYEGQPIAKVGQTGFATGPHLHFEVIVNGVRVDPKPYLGIK